MGKVQTPVGTLKGKAGGLTFFVQNGRQMMIPSKRSVRNPKTEAQMKQRVKMNNVLSAYHHMKGFLQNTFEGMIGNKNAAGFFRSHNLMLKPVWMTMQNKLNDDFVLAPYVVSNGIFPSIGYAYKDGSFVSDIEIGNLELSENTEIWELTNYILHNSDNWAQGDVLEIVLLRQAVPSADDESGKSTKANVNLPDCSAVSLVLSNDNMTRLADVGYMESLSHRKVEIKLCNIDGHIAVKAEGNDVYACAMIHTRGSKQTLKSSPQSLCLSNTTLYDYFTGDEAMASALKSYKTQGYK